MVREGLHRPAWSCGTCRGLWAEALGRCSRGLVGGPGSFERWAERFAWVMHSAVVRGYHRDTSGSLRL